MTFYFRTFRRALSSTGVMMFISAMTIVLTFFTLSSFSYRAVPWLLVAIQTLSFMRALWSFVLLALALSSLLSEAFRITRKSLLHSAQSVASEGIGLFSLFPFHLILALIVATTEFRETPRAVNVLLRTFVISGSVIHATYTAYLVTIAMITVSAFDSDVWIRDIDSSPSPFPLPILFAFLCSRIPTWWHLRRDDQSNINNATEPSQAPCMPPCTCPPKPEQIPHLGNAEHCRNQEGAERSRPLPQLLIRVPDAVERRAWIVISFDGLVRGG